MKSLFQFICLICLINSSVVAQPFSPVKDDIYDDTVVPRIDITLEQDSLNKILKDIYSDREFSATFIFNNGTLKDTMYNVGLSLRGNTSRDSKKKSFKISFNTFKSGRKFHGIEKMNLNGEHNDPSIIRSKLYWELCKSMKIPAPVANHVALYINGEYRGLYISVEHIDEEFLKKRFGNNNGNLYKCVIAADLEYRGENASDYNYTSGSRNTPVYGLNSPAGDYDYSELIELIKILNFSDDNNFRAKLEAIFNVNAFLRTFAVDIASGNWDNYAYNANNYYLYKNPETGKFEFIPYDSDNSYGIDWIGTDWGTRNIYTWENSNNPRKLVSRIMAFQEYRDRFSFFMNQIQSRLGKASNINPLIDIIYAKIKSYAEADQYRTYDYGFSWDDFVNSYTKKADYYHTSYGLKPFISKRYINTNSQLVKNNVPTILSELRNYPKTPYVGDTVYFKVWIEDESSISNAKVKYLIDDSKSDSIPLFNDGLHNDELANDHIWSSWIIVPAVSKKISYYVQSFDLSNKSAREPRVGYQIINLVTKPKLVINEVMASNLSSIKDEAGELEDWIEIYNADNKILNLQTFTLTDNPAKPGKYHFPNKTIAAGKFQLVWADNDEEQGPFHAGFKLDSKTEWIGLYEQKSEQYFLIDSISYDALASNKTLGCKTDGLKPYAVLNPTPGASNTISSVNETDVISLITIYPNPATDFLNLEMNVMKENEFKICLFDITGRNVAELYQGPISAGRQNLSLNLSEHYLNAGIYFLSMEINGQVLGHQKKVLINE